MLKVYVVGNANSGKSTISEVIRQALSEYGVDARVVPFLHEETAVDMNWTLDDRMKSIVNKLDLEDEVVEIEERQLARSGAFHDIK